MAELVWPGKRGKRDEGKRAQGKAPTCTTDEVHGSPVGKGGDPWSNRLIFGDAAQALRSLSGELAGRVPLVYIDPPFDTGSEFAFRATIPGAPGGASRAQVPAYRDARGLDCWLAWFEDVALALRDLLADGGSLYVHLDARMSHYAKVLLDEVFGQGAFQREIVWRIGWVSGYKSRSRGWVRNHDTLLFYAKGGRPKTFHKEYVPYPRGYVRRDGKAPTGQGVPIDDVWNGSALDRMDSIQIVSFSGEKVGYPTQKNEALVARIVRASSDPGDMVLDCFAGSGTTAVVAEKLGRRWVTCDSSPVAIHATRKRLLALPGVKALVVQSVAPCPRTTRDAPLSRGRTPGAQGAHGKRRRLGARASVEGERATIELWSFALPTGGALASGALRAKVRHWSQWIDGYCIDWDHRGGALNADSRAWRTRGDERLPLSVTHVYDGPGQYVALIKAFDVLGGATTTTVRFNIAAGH